MAALRDSELAVAGSMANGVYNFHPNTSSSPLCILRRDDEGNIAALHDREELKELFAPTGAARQFLEIQTAFRRAGYEVRRAELSPHRPVAVVVLRLSGCSVTSDGAALKKRAVSILRQARIWFDETNVSTRLQGGTLLVSFLWEPPAADSLQSMEFDELLRLLP